MKKSHLPINQPPQMGLPESSPSHNFMDTKVEYDPIYQMEYEKINEPYGKDIPIGYLNNQSVDFHYIMSNIKKIAKYLKK